MQRGGGPDVLVSMLSCEKPSPVKVYVTLNRCSHKLKTPRGENGMFCDYMRIQFQKSWVFHKRKYETSKLIKDLTI